MSVSSDDVERVLPAARRADSAALAVLWGAFQPRLLRYLRGRGVDDAEDVATQVWIDAARNLHRFRGDGVEFRRWLFTIAHRRVVDERRRAARAGAPVPVRLAGEGLVPGADVEFDVQDSLARALVLIARLPEQMRDVILLRVVADLSVADAAEVLGLRAGHVRVLMYRALARLEGMLADDGGEVVTLRVPASMKSST